MKLDKATVIRIGGYLLVLTPILDAIGKLMTGQHVDWQPIIMTMMAAAGGTQVASRAGDTSPKHLEAKVDAKVAEIMRTSTVPGANE